MGGIDFVVSIGTDQHQVLHIGLSQQTLKQIQRRRVKPLQIVQKQRKRMFRPCEYANKSPKHQLEAALRVLGRKLREWRLFSCNEPQFRNQVYNELAVRA